MFAHVAVDFKKENKFANSPLDLNVLTKLFVNAQESRPELLDVPDVNVVATLSGTENSPNSLVNSLASADVNPFDSPDADMSVVNMDAVENIAVFIERREHVLVN